MKAILKYITVLLLGAFAGAAATWFVAQSKIEVVKADVIDASYDAHRTLAYSNLISAAAWRKGDVATLNKYLDVDMLPAGLRFLEKYNRDDSSFEYFAWRLKKYYTDNGIEVPLEARPILEGIPAERPKYAGRILEDEPSGENASSSPKPPAAY